MKTKQNQLHLTSSSPKETQRLGTELGSLSQVGDIFLLAGNLGSGKTCLTQGIAWGLDVKEYAFSPTFVIVREYHGRLPLYHVDLYRLDRIEEILDLGLEEYFYGNGVCVVEWADKGMQAMPVDNLLVTLSHVSETERTIQLEANGQRYYHLIESLKGQEKIWN